MHPPSCPPAAPTACPTYLDTLNDAQRSAALHGIGTGAEDGPLLVIAGAGSGKTNTLAHRVAHLLAQGADPARILLLTFSRRAADEMTRRVQRIAAKVSPRHARLASGGFPWAGTFHSVGARLLREFAGRISLDPIVARIPAGRLATPDEIANAILYLCTDAADNVNGRDFIVGGDEVSLCTLVGKERSIFQEGGWTLDALDRVFPQTLGQVIRNPMPRQDKKE